MSRWISDHPVATAGIVCFVFVGGFILPIFAFSDSGQYFGSLVGSGVGLIAILIGAMHNAELERRRDDRLHHRDTLIAVRTITLEFERLADLFRSLHEVIGRTIERKGEITWQDLLTAMNLLQPSLAPRSLKEVVAGEELTSIKIDIHKLQLALSHVDNMSMTLGPKFAENPPHVPIDLNAINNFRGLTASGARDIGIAIKELARLVEALEKQES